MKVAVIALMLLTYFAVRSKAVPVPETRNQVLLELLARYLDDELNNAKRTVEIVPEALKIYDDLKKRRMYKWYTFILSSDGKKIVPDEFALPSSYVGVDADKAAWADLINHLPNKEPRFAAFLTQFIWHGVQKDKVVFVAWTPVGANIKAKMSYTAGKDYLKKAFNAEIELQPTDDNEITYDIMFAKVTKNLQD